MRSAVFSLALAAALAAADGPRFTSDGQLLFPRDYREWVFVTSGLGMSYSSDAPTHEPRFDNVFVTRAAYQSFLEKGSWPDGTMFILEVRASQSKASINKDGRFQSGIEGIEAEVKTSGKWAFYGFGKGSAAAKQIPASANCYSCHSEHGAVDNTFVQFYPTLLNVAKARGTLRQ
jgi:hypothetical protein